MCSYDVENRLIGVPGAGLPTLAFEYDGDGVLRKTTENGNLKTRYITPEYEVTGAGEPVVYYRFGGRAVAWHNNSVLRYLLADHLGSTHGETNESGAETAQRRYGPWGSDRAVSGANDVTREERYTGQRRVEAGGGAVNDRKELYHYDARAYLPGVGIFTQPDTATPEPADPQTLNPYSYALNNSLRYADPSGHAASDLQYLVPDWYDQGWHDQFVHENGREPEAVDYVYRFVTMGKGSGYAAEDVLRSVTTAIGAGLTPSGPGLWSQPVDQTGLKPGPAGDDLLFYGDKFTELRWGKVRMVYANDGSRGGLVRLLNGFQDNATTFGDDLIVFNRALDFSKPGDQWWLLHELGHVMQAQKQGWLYLPTYLRWTYLGHAAHPLERDANAFANGSGTGVIRWD